LQFLRAELPETLAFLPLEPVFRVETGDELIQISPLERIRLQREMLVRPQIVSPLKGTGFDLYPRLIRGEGYRLN
jgi:hypothetical protein